MDESAAGMLDEQTGVLTSGANPTRRSSDKFGDAYGEFKGQEECIPARGADSGGASRFFYVAKASSAERNAGLDGFEEVTWRTTGEGLGLRREPGSLASTDQPTQRKPTRNVHPTVKPIELMRWLVRLVTPPDGIVLDPFTGSGTTGCAAALERMAFVGIEREPEYILIAEARIGWWAQHPDGIEITKAIEADKKRQVVADSGQLGLL
jgi:site-specific DNA-methyltransferase (adenine-specific)